MRDVLNFSPTASSSNPFVLLWRLSPTVPPCASGVPHPSVLSPALIIQAWLACFWDSVSVVGLIKIFQKRWTVPFLTVVVLECFLRHHALPQHSGNLNRLFLFVPFTLFLITGTDRWVVTSIVGFHGVNTVNCVVSCLLLQRRHSLVWSQPAGQRPETPPRGTRCGTLTTSPRPSTAASPTTAAAQTAGPQPGAPRAWAARRLQLPLLPRRPATRQGMCPQPTVV